MKQSSAPPPAPQSPLRPALKDIVSEAARSLARLDAARLEELALSCQALNRDLVRDSNCDAGSDLPIKKEQRVRLAAEARAARREMTVFARVLEATRANVQVIERLRALRSGTLEYKVGQSAGLDPRWPSIKTRQAQSSQGETRHGND
jgi:hypothetical protein